MANIASSMAQPRVRGSTAGTRRLRAKHADMYMANIIDGAANVRIHRTNV